MFVKPVLLKSRHLSHGFSLIEALVALIVVGVGMLGIAALYVTTLRANGSALSRGQAVNLASDLGDRIRANRNAGAGYQSTGNEAVPGVICQGSGTTCTAAQLAASDLYLWQMQVNAALPGNPSGTVAVDTSTTPTTYTITVTWTEPNDTSALSYAMRMQQ